MSDTSEAIFLGAVTNAPDIKQYLSLKWANRHGLIAGATGTGKTVTLQALAEGFSRAGVPVFMADVKGDLSGLCEPSAKEDFLLKRADIIGLENYTAQAFPVAFWDLFGKAGHPVRTTVSDVGPLLLARMLELNDTQEGVLGIAFRYAEDNGLLLLDMKDLRALLNEVHDKAGDISRTYGQVSKPSIATVQRALLRLEDQGGAHFFGEPALDLRDLIRTDIDGRGMVNILAADELMKSPRLYATFLMWLLTRLFDELPEAGDAAKPRLVFFFDEAHLLFDDAPKSLLDKIEQVVRLIRSKGVGIYFVTQNPQDIPDSVLGQLGNRIQHGLRAFTPAQQKFIDKAAQTYRANPDFDVKTAITDLGVGEALVSVLEDKGNPSMVQRTLIRPPSAKLGVADAAAKTSALARDGIGAKYDVALDRESAHEVLSKRNEAASKKSAKAQGAAKKARKSNRQSVGEAAMKTFVRRLATSAALVVAAVAQEFIKSKIKGKATKSSGKKSAKSS